MYSDTNEKGVISKSVFMAGMCAHASACRGDVIDHVRARFFVFFLHLCLCIFA